MDIELLIASDCSRPGPAAGAVESAFGRAQRHAHCLTRRPRANHHQQPLEQRRGDPLTGSAQVKEFFEQHAGQWDQMHQGFYSTDVIDALAEHSALGPEAHLVDVGTGTGFIAGGLAARARRVTGTDSSPAMLAQARANLGELGIGNVALVEASVERLPLGGHSADAAVANMVLHHVPDPAAMITEMARVVRGGGTVAITDCIEHDHEWMRTEQADLWLGFAREQMQRLFAIAGLVDFDYTCLGTA